MLANLVNFFGKAVQPQQVTTIRRTSYGNNPFANPFVTSDNPAREEGYGKNSPVRGGYFAGYYNGKPNIVGTRLFVEV